MKKLIMKEGFGIVALTILLIPQVAHTVYVFNINSQYKDPWFGWLYAIGVDLAILIFTVKGWKGTAIAYFFGTLAHNIVYQFWPESVWSSILICIMLSATIFSFSHLFYSEKAESGNNSSAAGSSVDEEAKRLTEARVQGIKVVALPFQCPACSESFVSSKKLNGHISSHKIKSEWKPEKYNGWEEDNKRRASIVKNLELIEVDPE